MTFGELSVSKKINNSFQLKSKNQEIIISIVEETK